MDSIIYENEKMNNDSLVIDDGRIELLKEFLTPEELYNDLIERVKKYHPSSDISIIEKAYSIANEAHKGQVRKSGEPYIIHPLYVAIILADLELDKETIVAGILHDVVEDTIMTNEQITEMFGADVAHLVDGVTKLQTQINDANLDYSAIKLEMQAENLRKMFLAMAKDIRVILIKLADRLHNMRTLKHMPQEKQLRIAKETLEIYSPLAMRLGISKIKVELDDLSLKYLQPDVYEDLKNQISAKKSEREQYIQSIVDEVREHITEAGIEAKIDGRIKHFFSIYKKMKNQNKSLDQIYDLFAVRIIVESVKDCYATLGVIHEIYTPYPGRFKDYIAMPKKNMYQSLHTTLIGKNGQPFEIQIRTYEMHKAAEFGIAAHWKYKEASDGKKSSLGEEEKLDWLRRILEWQTDMSDNKEFMSVLKSDLDLFSDDVYCFTPTGEVKNLPAGSTPIDFAYAIHSAVGNKMVGARVNGRMVPIDYEIKNGDRVEITTSNSSKGPSRDWLKVCKSSQAKNKINQWFKQELKDDNIVKGRELLLAFCKSKNIDPTLINTPAYTEAVMQKYNYKSWDGILAAVGHGGLREGQIINKMVELYNKDHPRELTDEDIIAQIEEHAAKSSSKSRNNSGIVVRGIEDLAVRCSKCCSPVPGDEIVGFVTRGRGISIHRKDCVNMLCLTDEEKARLIDAKWQDDDKLTDEKFFAVISVYALDRTGILGDLTRVFTERNISIQSLNSHIAKNGTCTMSISFDISGTDELQSIISKVMNIEGVISAKRTSES